ncbi:MAG TPA: hypothetical protein VNH84_16440 [Candidatus Saccharimonadales bacterium]|nr:hypothetical protein [Candidatus Saccharimonadales bacterium]
MNQCQPKFAPVLAFCLMVAGNLGGQSQPANPPAETPLPGHEVAPGVRLIGHLGHPRLSESSGVAASRRFPGIFWTHNDGGGGHKQILFAITREGKTMAEFVVADVTLVDWEDIAIDAEGHLFVGDLGNNDLKRRELRVVQIAEPDPKSLSRFAPAQRTWTLRFPDQPFDCESLFIWDKHGYVVSKVFKDARAQIFRFPLQGETNTLVLEWVATTKVDSPVTGADISPDGRLLALVAKSGAFVYRVNGDISRAGKGKPYETKFRHEHIEACAFVPEGLLATAESREVFLFTDPPFHPHPRGSGPDGPRRAPKPKAGHEPSP